MLNEQQIKQIKELYSKYFKDSACDVSKGCLGDYNFIHCYLAKDNTECANGIAGNDAFKIMLELGFKNNGYQLSAVRSFFAIKPTNKYCYCDFERVAFRKVDTQDFNKIIETLKRYFERLHKQVKNAIEINNLLDNKIGISDLELAKKHIVL